MCTFLIAWQQHSQMRIQYMKAKGMSHIWATSLPKGNSESHAISSLSKLHQIEDLHSHSTCATNMRSSRWQRTIRKCLEGISYLDWKSDRTRQKKLMMFPITTCTDIYIHAAVVHFFLMLGGMHFNPT